VQTNDALEVKKSKQIFYNASQLAARALHLAAPRFLEFFVKNAIKSQFEK
jgi:hypothetical protein